MQAGDSIGRRFLLLRAEDANLPGLSRYLAKDTRLGGHVTVDIITSSAPSAVVRAAQRARLLRDKRLSRVLAAGIERIGTERVFYAVTERPRGVRLDELLGKIAFTPASAAAVIGEAATALANAATSGAGTGTGAGTGLRHGLIRASDITVTHRGRVMLSGLGINGVVAAQSKLIKVADERSDAVALAHLYLTAITAMDPENVTLADIPADVPPQARDLCQALLKGTGPRSLADVTSALGTGDYRVLKALVAEAPSLWWPRAPLASITAAVGDSPEATIEALGADAGSDVTPDALLDSTRDAGSDAVDTKLVDAGVVDTELVDAELVDAELVTTGGDSDVIDGDVIELAAERPRTRFGRAVDDLDEFHDIVAAQNVGTQPSVAEALLERLHQRFPTSAPLANAAAMAHRRAQAAAPLNVGPFLIAMLVVAVFVAGIVGASLLTKPYVPDFDGHNNPPQTYPEYTVGSSPRSS